MHCLANARQNQSLQVTIPRETILCYGWCLENMSPAQLLQSLVRQQSFKSVTLFILPAILSDCNTGIRTRVKEDGQEKYIFNTRNIKAMKLNQFVTVEGTAGNETLIQDKQRGPCCLPLNQMLSLLSSPAPSPWALKVYTQLLTQKSSQLYTYNS